jgi:hypothetical protein
MPGCIGYRRRMNRSLSASHVTQSGAPPEWRVSISGLDSANSYENTAGLDQSVYLIANSM